MHRHRAGLVAGSLLVLLTLAAYWPVCGNDFVNYDDPAYVTGNPGVQAGLTPQAVVWAFTTTHGGNWHPLTWLSLQLDDQLFGLRPWGFHLTNLLLHTANVVLLFLALRRMTGAVWRSFLVAALFAVHPLHVESVAWVAERKDVLSGLFWMLTLWAYARYAERPGWGRYLLVLAAFALGLLAKPMLVTLPCVLLLLDYWPLRRFNGRAEGLAPSDPTPGASPAARPASWPRLLLEKLPLFALVAVSCAVTLSAQHVAVWSVTTLPLTSRVCNALIVYVAYIAKMLWPLRLAVFYPYPRAFRLEDVLAAGAVLVAITGLAVVTARRRPYLLVGWLWYLGVLVPVIGLVQVGKQQMADRYTYLPLIGLFLALVWGAAEVLAARAVRRPWPAVLAALVLLPCLAATWGQVLHWRTTEALWVRALQVTEGNPEADLNVGRFLEGRGRAAEAVALYREAVALDPAEPLGHYYLAEALERQGQLEEAASQYAAVARTQPDYHRAQARLAGCLHRLKRPEEALAMYEEVLRRDPGDVISHNDAGRVCSDLGRLTDAERHLTEALRINPNYAPAHINLGALLAEQGDMKGAAEHFAVAARLDPNNARAHCNLGMALAELGKTAEAAAAYRAALRCQPDMARARQGLAELGLAPD